jgi:cytochrome b6-f complex subunit 5
MVEPLLSGIVLGLIPITLLGLFFDAYMQYRRDNRLFDDFKKAQTAAQELPEAKVR